MAFYTPQKCDNKSCGSLKFSYIIPEYVPKFHGTLKIIFFLLRRLNICNFSTLMESIGKQKTSKQKNPPSLPNKVKYTK